MIKQSLKNSLVAGVVALFTSSSAFSLPLTNIDELDSLTPSVYSDKSYVGTATYYDGASAENEQHMQGRNANINSSAFNPVLQCQTPLIDTVPAGYYAQVIAAIQNIYFVPLVKTVIVGGQPTLVTENSDLRRLVDWCSAQSGVTQLAGGGHLYRLFTFYMNGQWPGQIPSTNQTPGICYVDHIRNILVRMLEQHQSGAVTFPQEVRTLFNMDGSLTAMGSESCPHRFCNTVESYATNEFCKLSLPY